MGVHTLWDLLSEAGEEHVKVTTLRGQKLAVDLSAWIVEFRQSKISSEFRNAYIRNLFFRTIYFMKEGVELVFVIDGIAPDLKQQALLSRQQAQFGSSSDTANPDRPFLKNITSQCVEMLGFLGLSCIQSEGEAEALCAHLNSSGALDGCLTEDNDFFLYGGKTVYRKLRKENKIYHVDRIDMEKITEKLGLARRDLVALALLLGCDYGDQKGVKCVGKEKGKALVELLKSRNLDVLQRLLGWRGNKELDRIEERLAVKMKKEGHCSKCKHLGQVISHESSGCGVCQTDKGCTGTSGVTCRCKWHDLETLRSEHKLELSLREKSLKNASFPNTMIVNEFLDPKLSDCVTLPKPSMDLPSLLTFLKKRLGWSCDDVLEKMVPVTILKQLKEDRNQSELMFTPIRIIRGCKDNHVDCYEVAWDKTDSNNWASSKFSTNILVKIEKCLFQTAYSGLVEQYERSLTEKKSSTGKKRKTDTSKSQMKLTDFTKIKKRLQFKDGVNSNTLEYQNSDLPEQVVKGLSENKRFKDIEIENISDTDVEMDGSLEFAPGNSDGTTVIDLTTDCGIGNSSQTQVVDLTNADLDGEANTSKKADVDTRKEIEYGTLKTDTSKPVNDQEHDLEHGTKADLEQGTCNAKSDLDHSKINVELKHGKANAGLELGKNKTALEDSRANFGSKSKTVCKKSTHELPSLSGDRGKGECKIKKSAVKRTGNQTQTSIVNFFEKKDSKSETDISEFTKNDTNAFKVLNSSTRIRSQNIEK